MIDARTCVYKARGRHVLVCAKHASMHLDCLSADVMVTAQLRALSELSVCGRFASSSVEAAITVTDAALIQGSQVSGTGMQ